MPPPPPPQPPAPPLAPNHRHHHLLKKPTSLPDAIFTALSLLVLFSTSPKSPSLFSLPTNSKLSFPLYPRKFPKMSSPFPNPRKPGRRPTPPPFATPQSLSDWLKPRLGAESFGAWGVKPGTKNVHNLWLEVVEGETVLTDSLPPVRTVEVVIVRIIRNVDGTRKLLIESHQELSNGAVRYRSRPLSEKMKPDESVEAAVLRAVKEELGSLVKIGNVDSFDGDGIVRILPGSYVKKVEERVSASYPGLPACYVLHSVDAEVAGLPEDEFCTEELDEYEVSSERDMADCAVSCRKHYWKWVDCDSV
ncbi:hypothetical protein PHJA_001018500 [Phtheirospermum japonicum]|uniref:Nudix hydrolase domain-containing protein n=1 Tax=Phtheirospermum japonicum TaxID=374723 RepID=A0A830BUW4_9LAMI|nr:hypothetical protein PHJA_001018500 [Phtheirospermum japonicum]